MCCAEGDCFDGAVYGIRPDLCSVTQEADDEEPGRVKGTVAICA